MITTGNHLRAVRSWIQRTFVNQGSLVNWGSRDLLKLDTTVHELEYLAQQIRDEVVREIQENLGVCADFRPNFKSQTENECKKCGYNRKLHVLLNITDPFKGEK